MVRALRMIQRMNQGPNTAPSESLYLDIIINYYKRVLQAHDEGKFMAAHTVFFPVELLYAMDIVPMHTEGTMWLLSLFTGDTSGMLRSGAELGLGPEICSAHRALAGGLSNGAIPRPDAMLWTNLICDNTAKSGELLMEINKCPGALIDYPSKYGKSEEQYLVGEYRDMIAFLEKQSGRKMDWDKLAYIVQQMNVEMDLLREIAQMRAVRPTPFSPNGFLKLVTADYLAPGQPDTIKYLTALRDELKVKVQNHEGGIPQERFRLMNLFIPPLYLLSTIEKVALKYGAIGVVEPFFCSWPDTVLDPAHPLESVARKSYTNPPVQMYSALDDKIIQHVVDDAKKYKVDGAIYYAHVGCRHACATVKLYKDILSEIDVPVLTVDCDIVDNTVTTADEIRDKMERFFELLEDR